MFSAAISAAVLGGFVEGAEDCEFATCGIDCDEVSQRALDKLIRRSSAHRLCTNMTGRRELKRLARKLEHGAWLQRVSVFVLVY